MNVLTITGTICKDVEKKEISGSNSLQMFCMVNTVGYGERKSDIFWDIQIWNNKFEKIIPFLKKGRSVTVVGTLQIKPDFYTIGAEVKLKNISVTAEIIHLLQGKEKKEKEEVFKPIEESPF